MVSREKLAQDLRTLAERFSEGWHDGIKIDALDIELLADAARALAELVRADERAEVERLRSLCDEMLSELYVYRASEYLKDVTAAIQAGRKK